MAQNSLEFKLPSRSSPPFYAKQRTLSPKAGEEKKKGHYGWLCPAPSQSSLWPISRIPCPSCLRDNYSEQQRWRRTGPLKTVAFHIDAYSFLGLLQQLTNLTAAPFRLIKGDLLLWSASLALFPNLAFNSLTLQTSTILVL